MLGDFASLDVQNTYRGSDAYVIIYHLIALTLTRLRENGQRLKPFEESITVVSKIFF
nr:hypothetical protein [Piscirickettsia salmonis]